LNGRFEDKTKYLELARRLAVLLDSEIKGFDPKDDKMFQKALEKVWGIARLN
jgi:hypothetical protein